MANKLRGMKKRIIILGLILTTTLLFSGCTEQTISREYGGEMTIDLKPGQKLEEITWKDESNLWILTRPMRDDEVAETHTFYEESEWGIWEGTVTIIEH